MTPAPRLRNGQIVIVTCYGETVCGYVHNVHVYSFTITQYRRYGLRFPWVCWYSDKPRIKVLQ